MIKENKVSGACKCIGGEIRNAYNILVRMPEGKRPGIK
jgi:hypothetical protein